MIKIPAALSKKDFVIVRSTDWYEDLERVKELVDKGFSVALLDRLSSSVSVLSEDQMNKLGWYKNEQ